jgi:hypothetical protein
MVLLRKSMIFLTSVIYILTFISGLFTYTALNGMTYLTRIISRGRIIPEDEDHREYWTYKPSGTLPWFIRAVQDPHHFFSRPEIREGNSTAQSPGSTLKRSWRQSLLTSSLRGRSIMIGGVYIEAVRVVSVHSYIFTFFGPI